MTPQITNAQLDQYLHFSANIQAQSVNGSLTPSIVMNAISPLIGCNGKKSKGNLSQPILMTRASHYRIKSKEDVVVSNCLVSLCKSRANADSAFMDYVDLDLSNWRFYTKQATTRDSLVLAYEMHNKERGLTDISRLFKINNRNILTFSLKEKLEKFAIENPSWFQNEGYGTFFLFTRMVENEEENFFTNVSFNRNGHLEVNILRKMVLRGVWDMSFSLCVQMQTVDDPLI